MKRFNCFVLLVLTVYSSIIPALGEPNFEDTRNGARKDVELSIFGTSSEAISDTNRGDAISTISGVPPPKDARISDSNEPREILNPEIGWPIHLGSNNNGNPGNKPKPPSRPSSTDVAIRDKKADSSPELARELSSTASAFPDGHNVNGSAGDVAAESLGRTHNNNGAPRRSFADAMRMIGRGSRLIQKNLVEAQKAYSEGGVLGIADYVATLPDFWAQPSAIDFLNVSVARSREASTVSAAISKALPLNGPPFVFNLANVLPAILEQVLEFRTIPNEKGENVKVVAFNYKRHILLNVTSVL